MPGCYLNELAFSGLSEEAVAQIEAFAVNSEGIVDFNILLPLSERLRGKWQQGDMEEIISIWGTKWNAQANKSFKMVKKPGVGRITLRFLTTNNKPIHWIEALLKRTKTSVEYTWCWGGRFGWKLSLDYRYKHPTSEKQVENDKELHKRMRKLYKKATDIHQKPRLEQSQVSTSSDDASEKIDDLALAITRAVYSCPHEIDAEKVVLKFEEKAEGHNALNQLSRRIKAAITENAKIFYPIS